MKTLSIITILFLITLYPLFLWAGGSYEGSSAPARGTYLSGQGIIVRPNEVYIDSYISSIDYRYPRPEAEFGITLYSGHRHN